MKLTQQIAKHLREIYFGGNWTASNFKESLEGLTWQQATATPYSFNSIATLVFHTHYYIAAVQKVLDGEKLNAKDELSFSHPSISSRQDWDVFLEKVFNEAETFAGAIEQLPDEILLKYFTEEKHGNYYRNINGIIEHLHYHLGQIVLIKKILQQKEDL